MTRQCLKCKKEYSGSWVGAMFQRTGGKKKEVGYFGGYCDCGAKLGDSYEYHGILNNIRRVYHKEDWKWRRSLSGAEYKRIFGGPKNLPLNIFTFNEWFLAKNKKLARGKFFKLLKSMRRDLEGKGRLTRASVDKREDGVYLAWYALETVRWLFDVERYLKLKRKNLAVSHDPL